MKSTNKATFSFAPARPVQDGDTKDVATTPDMAGPFINANRFRVYGLEVILIGAKPKASALRHRKTIPVTIRISTSGVYADVKDGQVLTFTSVPLSREYAYKMDADGKKRGKAISKSIFKAKNHVDPTPFTQWTIHVMNGDDLEFESLKDVKFTWKGVRDPETSMEAEMAIAEVESEGSDDD